MKEKNTNSGNEIKSDFPGKKKEEDSSVIRIQEYLKNNHKKILTVVSILVIVVTAVIFITKTIQEKQTAESKDASLALSRVVSYYNAMDYQKALYGDSTKLVRNEPIIGLVEIIQKYDGTPQAERAALYAGDCFLGLKKYDEAEKYFKIALESSVQLVLEGANAGMGVLSEEKGDLKKAADYYEKAADLAIATSTKNRYQFYAALCYEKSNNDEAAEKIYREIINENKSEFVGQSKAGLARLGKTIE